MSNASRFLSVEPKSILVAAGRFSDGSQLKNVEFLSTVPHMSVANLQKLPYGIYFTPSLVHQGEDLLLCGGSNNENKCLVYQNGWQEHSNLTQSRSYASSVTTVYGTFIFGGIHSQETFEFLPKDSKVWKKGQTYIPGGFIAGCAVKVPGKPEILLIGGISKSKRILKFTFLETEMYDGGREITSFIATFEEMEITLQKDRRDHTCAIIPGTNLTVIAGGKNNENKHDSTEILNLANKTIDLGNPMITKRRSHGMAVITIKKEDRLAVFGGINDNDETLNTVETLNPKTRKWENSDLKLKEAKSLFGYSSVPHDFLSNL